jgi:hypothetical protein
MVRSQRKEKTIHPKDMNADVIRIHKRTAEGSCWVEMCPHRRLSSEGRVHNGLDRCATGLRTGLAVYIFQITLHDHGWSKLSGNLFHQFEIKSYRSKMVHLMIGPLPKCHICLQTDCTKSGARATQPELLRMITLHSVLVTALHNAKAARPNRWHICTIRPVLPVPDRISRDISSQQRFD